MPLGPSSALRPYLIFFPSRGYSAYSTTLFITHYSIPLCVFLASFGRLFSRLHSISVFSHPPFHVLQSFPRYRVIQVSVLVLRSPLRSSPYITVRFQPHHTSHLVLFPFNKSVCFAAPIGSRLVLSASLLQDERGRRLRCSPCSSPSSIGTRSSPFLVSIDVVVLPRGTRPDVVFPSPFVPSYPFHCFPLSLRPWRTQGWSSSEAWCRTSCR